jgi:hypothetical protein
VATDFHLDQNQIIENQSNINSPNTPQVTSLKVQINHNPRMHHFLPIQERLSIDNLLSQPEFDFLGELKNVCVKIPLFQEIKYVPIYAKFVQELCLKKLDRRRKDPPTI